MAEIDPRIGYLNEDGTVKSWPKVNINNGGYDLPTTRHKIGANKFIVLPVGFNQWERVDELKGRPTPLVESVEPPPQEILEDGLGVPRKKRGE